MDQQQIAAHLAEQRARARRRESTLRLFTLPKLHQAALGALSVDLPEKQAQKVAGEIAETLLTHLTTCLGWVDTGQWGALQKKRRRAVRHLDGDARNNDLGNLRVERMPRRSAKAEKG